MQRLLFTAALCWFTYFLSYAQPVVKTTIDKAEILIGQQFNLKVEAKFSGDDFFIKWVNVPDSMLHFELIEKTKIDSLFTNQKLSSLSQTFTFTSFDSGKWELPSFNIFFTGQKNDTTLRLSTDSLPITVSFSVTDTSQTLKDIKAIKEVEIANPLWYWVAGLLVLLLLIGLVIWWYRNNKKTKKITLPTSHLSPYEEAMERLNKLSLYNLDTAKDVQQYHIELIEIFRVYLSRKQNSNYLNKTTGDILLEVNEQYRDTDIRTKVSTALRFSDAVKFARFIPIANDSTANKQLIKESIDLIESPAKQFKL